VPPKIKGDSNMILFKKTPAAIVSRCAITLGLMLLTVAAVDCSLGQSGPVWFLGADFGGIASRACKDPIPPDVALFFPVTNTYSLPGNSIRVQRPSRRAEAEADPLPGGARHETSLNPGRTERSSK